MIVCLPAYGRDYKSVAEVRRDWEAGKDFLMANHARSYINKSDAEHYGVPDGQVQIRYNSLRDVMIIGDLPTPKESV